RRTPVSRRPSTTSSAAATGSGSASSTLTSARSRRSPRSLRYPAATWCCRSIQSCSVPPRTRSGHTRLRSSPRLRGWGRSGGARGPIDLQTALATSVSTFSYEIGQPLNDRDPHSLPNTAKSFRLVKATDIDFVFEADGIVPSPDWKKQHFTNPADQVWNPGDATNLAIGQGFLLATPLQMANYVSTLANDGIVWKPRLVIELRDRDGQTVKPYPK